MIEKSTVILLRFPFSFFLLPIFLLGVASLDRVDPFRAAAAFFLIHFLLYPASNAFNSYYDRDTSSIGGVRNPPPPTKQLLVFSLAFDALAVALAFVFDAWFALNLFVYGLASKAYSWDRTRLKKYPVFSWLGTGLVQGFYTVLMTCEAVRVPGTAWFTDRTLHLALLSSVFLLAVYPITQVYQHREDAARGDRTMSMLVGIRGTFVLSGLLLSLSFAAFVHYFLRTGDVLAAWLFPFFLAPAAFFFFSWCLRVWKNEARADFISTMVMNSTASAGLNIFLLLFAVRLI